MLLGAERDIEVNIYNTAFEQNDANIAFNIYNNSCLQTIEIGWWSKSMHARTDKRNQLEKNLLSSWLFEIVRREHNNGKGKILERWSEYISELYHDERGDEPPIMKKFDGPPIMKDEVRKAVESMKKGKAARPDKVTVEMIESLDEFGIDMLTDFLNALYDSG